MSNHWITQVVLTEYNQFPVPKSNGQHQSKLHENQITTPFFSVQLTIRKPVSLHPWLPYDPDNFFLD